MTPRGCFVAFEGGEASGKSTQAAVLAARLGAVLTREPGGTLIGGHIRALVLDPANAAIDPRTESLLLAADRAQHVREVVEPALVAGHHVVSDRFSGSTLAYQGYGQGLDRSELSWLSTWASGGLEPDVVILLDVDPSAAAGRQAGQALDRLESRHSDFHDRVRAGYRSLAAADPERWTVVDGSASADEVTTRVWDAVSSRLDHHRP
ncbi:MAG: dTMP kinase [Actinobacteria bacterium]|nr:dTMP kinase [Actinomycetota bacterium]